MNYYFVKDGQIISGKINASNPKESTIMGARVIEGRDLTITSDYTMLVPYVYVELSDAIERAKLWTKERKQVLSILTNGTYPYFALIDNRVLPVTINGFIEDEDGESYDCTFLNKQDELEHLTAHSNEIHDTLASAFAALTKSLC